MRVNNENLLRVNGTSGALSIRQNGAFHLGPKRETAKDRQYGMREPTLVAPSSGASLDGFGVTPLLLQCLGPAQNRQRASRMRANPESAAYPHRAAPTRFDVLVESPLGVTPG